MLVVSGGDILFARNITFRQNSIDVIETAASSAGLNQPRLKLDLARIGQIQLVRRAEIPVFINCMNIAHGDTPADFALF